MRILLLASHEIAEYDDLRMFTEMGHEVFCPGGYQNPREHSGLRPAVPDAPVFPELIEACERVRRERGDPGPMIDWAKAALPDEVIDWAEVIIVHHFPERWIGGQWERIRHKRVVWRTCGQSNPELEAYMAQGRAEGMQIVRYSPKERNLPNFAGEDALIRFGKDPDEYGPWNGNVAAIVEEDAGANPVIGSRYRYREVYPYIANVTQHMLERGEATGLTFYQQATEGLPAVPAGPGSKALGGLGELSYDEMKRYLAGARVYLYTGTRPASYTLGLIEAMLTGTPVVSIGPGAFGPGWVGEVFEAHGLGPTWSDDPAEAREALEWYLRDDEVARDASATIRDRAIELFDLSKIKAEWAAFLTGEPGILIGEAWRKPRPADRERIARIAQERLS